MMTQVNLLNTVERAAELLQCSPRTIHRRIKSGQLEAVRDGRSVRIPGEALIAYTERLRATSRVA